MNEKEAREIIGGYFGRTHYSPEMDYEYLVNYGRSIGYLEAIGKAKPLLKALKYTIDNCNEKTTIFLSYWRKVVAEYEEKK